MEAIDYGLFLLVAFAHEVDTAPDDLKIMMPLKEDNLLSVK